MSEGQAGAGVIALFRVVSIKLLLAPFGVGQGTAVGALDIGSVGSGPHAVQVERSPRSFRRGPFGRLNYAPAFPCSRAACPSALAGSGSAFARAIWRRLGCNQN